MRGICFVLNVASVWFIAIITLLIVVGLFKGVTGAQPLNATALQGVVPGISIALVFAGRFHLVLLP